MKDFKSDLHFQPDLQCYLTGVAVNLIEHTADLHLGSGGCTSMGGAIRFCRRIDPDIRLIRTWSDDLPDTEYHRRIGTTWQAFARDAGQDLGWADPADFGEVEG